MWNWLARKIGERALRNAIVELDTDKRYMLIVDVPDDEVAELKRSLRPVMRDIDMIVITAPQFYLFNFGAKNDENR